MTPFTEEYKKYCEQYLSSLRNSNAHIKTNEDTAKVRDRVVKKYANARSYSLVRNKIKSPGTDVISSPALDHVVVAKFASITPPKKTPYPFEDNFLVFDRAGALVPSAVFQMPENGGKLNFSCQLGYMVDWSTVVAVAHTHPLYWNKNVNKLNKKFSAGDPSVLLARQIPLYLRTPKGKEIKVLEIRNGWVTTRRVDKPGSKAKKWLAND